MSDNSPEKPEIWRWHVSSSRSDKHGHVYDVMRDDQLVGSFLKRIDADIACAALAKAYALAGLDAI